MLAKALSCAVVGLDGAIVEVEVDLSPGLPPLDSRPSPSWAYPTPPSRKPRSGSGPRSEIVTVHFRTGVSTVVADSILHEGVIRALADATDRFELGP